MRKGFVVLAAIGLLGCQGARQPEVEVNLNDQLHKRSYGMGMNTARQFKQMNLEIDPEVFVKGFRDQSSDGEKLMTEEDVKQVLMDLQNERMAEQRAKRDVTQSPLAVKNKKDGAVFLAANKEKEGVVTLESGLQYKVLREGKGDRPTRDQRVRVHYRGTLIDGTEFDSSYKRGQPIDFGVGGVIKGWTEALLLMPKGSKWELCIPGDLAYGTRGAGAQIGPNATLLFEVELLEVLK
ncbi:MAG: FKBP-type peptidyl-prolyl cis-trans isomerase [bacterium]|nr:FKBP-type peptidyl-prolyl cis-trans isomerase [bacterium]